MSLVVVDFVHHPVILVLVTSMGHSQQLTLGAWCVIIIIWRNATRVCVSSSFTQIYPLSFDLVLCNIRLKRKLVIY